MIYVSHLMDDCELQKLIAATGMGVETIEFSIGENLDRLPKKAEAYRKRLERMGDPLLSVHGPFLDLNPVSYDSLVAAASRKRYETAYEAAQILGAAQIIFHSCFLPRVYFKTGWAERLADFWNDFLKGKTGIQVLMENVYDPWPEVMLETAKRVTHPDFGICLDIGHANCYSEVPVKEWAKILSPCVRHLHVHDNDRTADSHLALGRGDIPFLEIMEMLKGQKRNYTIECSSREAVLETWEILKASDCV